MTYVVDDDSNRLYDLRVTVSKQESDINEEGSLCGMHAGIMDEVAVLIECELPLVGRFVHVQMMTQAEDNLNFNEIEVWGY